MHFHFSQLKSFVRQDWYQELHSCDPNASLDTNINSLGLTMANMATMAVSLSIIPVWNYCHSDHSDHRLYHTINMGVYGS